MNQDSRQTLFIEELEQRLEMSSVPTPVPGDVEENWICDCSTRFQK